MSRSLTSRATMVAMCCLGLGCWLLDCDALAEGPVTTANLSYQVRVQRQIPSDPRSAELANKDDHDRAMLTTLPRSGSPSTRESSTAVTPVRVWDGRSVGCAAARNWQPAAAIELRRKTLTRLYCQQDDACVRAGVAAFSTFLSLQAERQCDLGAAQALQAYYGRLAIVEQLQVLQQASSLNDSQAEKQQLLQLQGLAAQIDLSQFERQKLELLDQSLQLSMQERQLRNLLNELTNTAVDYATASQEQLEIFTVNLDEQRLIDFAFRHREDLLAWQHLSHNVSDASAPLFAKLLGANVAGAIPLPSTVGLKALLCSPEFNCLGVSIKHELEQIVRLQADEIRRSVRERVNRLELNYERIDIASQLVSSWERRIAQLEQLDNQGQARPQELALAASSLLTARTNLIKRRLEARQAEIDLAESVGGLTQRCCVGIAWLVTGYE